MTTGMLPPMLSLKPLERISPSQFPIFRKCKLRAIWSSCHAQALLPLPPPARLGIVIHKILEKAGKGKITGYDSFYLAWTSCVQKEENKMSSSWIEKHLVPLERSVHNYEVKKLGNGLMLLKLIPDSQKSNIITVRGLRPDRHPALNKTPDEVSVFSIIPGKVPGSYGEGHLTTIYAGAG